MVISSAYDVRLAKDAEDLLAVQRLRYDVFVRELVPAGLRSIMVLRLKLTTLTVTANI